MIHSRNILWAFLLGFAPVLPCHAEKLPLFDGKSLDGWEIRKGEEAWWKVQDGMIIGGSLTEKVPFNTFLASRNGYGDFELTFKIRLVKGEGFMNSGMQIRSQRVDGDSEMAGYQVDAGTGYWGDLYDESRRNTAVAKAPGVSAKDWEWNDYRILCEGPRIRTWINGVAAVDYTEADASIPRDGRLGLQAHGGGKFLVQLKDIFIDELVPNNGARSPEAERAGFTLPAGYTAELVSSEEQGVGKPITVAWDRHGRMWTTTALEYPVDANENEAIARELYKRGGKDRVLVFDEPNQPGPLTPRVFAEGLAIPLGVLPLKDSVLVQNGPEIRSYRDADGDGKADGFDVVLNGFGIQDSHLFPHQFERTTGGWLYLAQGAFNYSQVQRPGGMKFADGTDRVAFNNCKLARFRADGSEFQPMSNGPNNIWGLAIARNGEVFVQEANDMGLPVAEFEPGTHYLTFAGGKLRDDVPTLPQSTPGQPMGGTGLSGIAMAEDAGSPFAKDQGDGSVFYIANPITSKIQVVTMTRDASGHPVYRKGADFLTSADPWFRPISSHFGPDGCLYIVDWYNKIISHNEVPRVHPDRDKTHGRIWRIRHSSQPAQPARVDLAALPENDLPGLLGGSNSRVASQAWQEIIDRHATGLAPALQETLANESATLAKRFGALWALEGLGAAGPDLLRHLASASSPELRYEAVRMAGESSLGEKDFLAVIDALGDEPNYRVRWAIVNAVRFHREPTLAIATCAARLGLAPMDGRTREGYDRNFQRGLVRWALSGRPEIARQLAQSTTLPTEARLLAARALDPAEAAVAVVNLLPDLARPLIPDELSLLAGQFKQAAVMRAYRSLLDNKERRAPMLRATLLLDSKASAAPGFGDAVQDACFALLKENRTAENERLVAQLARKFRRTALTGEVQRWISRSDVTPADLAEGLATLRETGEVSSEVFSLYLDHTDDAVRRAAMMGFANADDIDSVIKELAKRWPGMSGTLRALAVDALTSSRMGPAAFAKALVAGQFQGFDGTAVEKLVAALGPDNADVVAILKANKGLLEPVLRFGNGGPGRILTDVSLKGPFTVEAWVRLPAPIDNNDGLLGKQGGPDINFAGARLRVYGGDSVGDVIIANRAISLDQWTHCAITRDATNRFKIYLDGEADFAEGREFAGELTGFNPGESHRGRETVGDFDEMRIWNVARTPEEIRNDAHTRYSGTETPAGLALRVAGDHPSGTLEGSARIAPITDFPKLVSPAEAAELNRKFAHFAGWAALPGDAARGREIVKGTCMICHQIQGEGTIIGPNLSGAGAMGSEALLRNILTPNAQLESGYYRHDIRLDSGLVVSGFLVEESADSITLRQIGASDRAIPRSAITSHEISRRSLMPEGLIDGFTAQQVADLFTYLKTLR